MKPFISKATYNTAMEYLIKSGYSTKAAKEILDGSFDLYPSTTTSEEDPPWLQKETYVPNRKDRRNKHSHL